MSSEYTGQNIQSCAYAKLATYNKGGGLGPKMVSATATSGQYIVPAYSASGYNTLTSKVPSCSGYRDISNAYGSGSGGACNQKYVTRLCQ